MTQQRVSPAEFPMVQNPEARQRVAKDYERSLPDLAKETQKVIGTYVPTLTQKDEKKE